MRVQTIGGLMGVLIAGTVAGSAGWYAGQLSHRPAVAAAPSASSQAAATSDVQAPKIISDYLQGVVDTAMSNHAFVGQPQTRLLTVEANNAGTTVAIYEMKAQTDSGPADIILEVSSYQGKVAGSRELHRLEDPAE
ncbi:MAG TPA: hypothetical protein VK009_18450 [Chloroflexota bacterium]|nr:hypothetical protein [Chloroflexota bacterium]